LEERTLMSSFADVGGPEAISLDANVLAEIRVRLCKAEEPCGLMKVSLRILLRDLICVRVVHDQQCAVG
jgi:hypothetical protein